MSEASQGTRSLGGAGSPNRWQDSVKPVVVIVVICAVVGLLLGGVNNATTPIIMANREAEAWATYSALIPDAAGFTALPVDTAGVTACMEADDNKGYAITAQAKGYSGQVPMAVAFAADGTIENVIGMTNTETPGLGTKVSEEAFTTQFVGRAAEPLALADIDAITGATISSKAALAAVNEAVEAYRQAASGTLGSASASADEKGAA